MEEVIVSRTCDNTEFTW